MQLKAYPDIHLTYCTNIHPGESWDEVFDQLKVHVPELKQRLSPDSTFGVGLRLSAAAAAELLNGRNLAMFKEWLNEEEAYVFTMNGFPYGDFHRQRVKDLVYAPDWRTEERVTYTLNLATILAELLPEGLDGGISTSPISYKYWLGDASIKDQAFCMGSKNLAQVAYKMAQIQEAVDKELHLDIEPEPDCLLENSRETLDFFQSRLLPVGSAFLAGEFGLSHNEAAEVIKRHIRVCYDTCHFAVAYEHPSEAIRQLHESGIRIGKTQISAALKVALPDSASKRRLTKEKLRPFVESTYLHQVIERRTDGSLYHYKDLSEALPHIYSAEAEEWRIHYHVPVFVDQFDGLNSTQDDITKSLDILKQEGNCRHFEIETYTWDVLPDELKMNLPDSIEREYEWVLASMNS